ncbi:MAG TPA: hypothetical protein VFK41_06505 [Nocardioidaceae bacterium]|nr:hypothetical protein [Nocardioidaceae bacterium]
MTATDIELPSAIRRNAAVSQQTAIEQARAVAEVAAQVRVAKDFPRDLAEAHRLMREACDSLDLAQRAFYSVPNRGHDSSVHLLRELARCWGNIQHGVVELSRDDERGESEVQAWAWDVETNSRSVRSFIVPHAVMKGKGENKTRKALDDLTDIVNNNNSVGSRAVRETIRHVLPVGFVKEAERLCEARLVKGDGEPLEVRIGHAIANFGRASVTVPMLEKRLGVTQDKWTEEDLATLAVLYASLKAGETTKAEEFPDLAEGEAKSTKVTAEEITGVPDNSDVAANDPASGGGS